MAKNKRLLKSIILTLRNELVVVPNAAVAEIISVQNVKEVEDAPGWMLGKTTWRGVELPVVSFEAAGGDDAQAVNINTQIAVLYSANTDEDKQYSYIGLAMHGVPHVSQFSRDQIKTDPDVSDDHPMVAQRVRINGAAASILDIVAVDDMLQQLAIA
jgi:chemosensory pili system protein ChpC